jgi:hypothetical protein
MIVAQARLGAARRRALYVTLDSHVREEAQRSDDYPVHFDEALDKLGNTERRQVGYKTVL